MANHFLIAAISLIFLFLSPLTTANSPVIDIEGNPLEPGSAYYVVTSGWGAAGRGGLAAHSKDRLCPLFVGQYSWWNERGSPVTITPNNSTNKEIIVGADVSIAFGPNQCRSAGVWQLSFNSERVPLINNDGTAGEFASTFKIEGSNGSYKIVYCFATPVHPIWPPPPPQPDNCQQLDATIPVKSNDFSWLSLVPYDNPLPFFGFGFLKVKDDSSSTM